MSSKRLLFTVLVSAVGIFLVVFYYELISGFSKCAMKEGPIYGKEISINLENTIVDTFVRIPNGQIAFVNTRFGKDTLNSKPPILFKIDNQNKVLWAYEFENEDKGDGEENIGIVNIRLQNEDGKNVIKFFNEAYKEPGKIYLTKDYNFDYMCLSRF